MLTYRQRELLEFIADYMDTSDGISPSFEEMRIGVGLRSKSGVHRLITSLNERGYIRQLYHRARSIEVIRMPDGSGPNYSISAIEAISLIAKIMARVPNLR